MEALSYRDEIGILNELLQCELSSTETYQQVLEHHASLPGARQLSRFAADHQASADALQERIRSLGGSPVRDAGVWGRWTEGIAGAGQVVGRAADLDALKQEEEQSAAEYRRALEGDRLSRDCRELIESSLLPRVELHLVLVDQLLRGLPPSVVD